MTKILTTLLVQTGFELKHLYQITIFWFNVILSTGSLIPQLITKRYLLDKVLKKWFLISLSIQIINSKKTAESIVSYHKVFVYIKYHHYINLWTENIKKFRLHEFLILRKMKEPLPFLHANEMLYIKSSKNKIRRWKGKKELKEEEKNFY